MFNPFELFQPRLVEAFLKNDVKYLVTQTFEAGRDLLTEEGKTVLLFSHYKDISQARIHLSALTGDKYAAMFNLERDDHKDKIKEMMRPDSKYVIYIDLVKNKEQVETLMNKKYSPNIRRYIERNTNWRISADKTIYPRLDIAFGELYIKITYGNQQIRFKLGDLEKI